LKILKINISCFNSDPAFIIVRSIKKWWILR